MSYPFYHSIFLEVNGLDDAITRAVLLIGPEHHLATWSRGAPHFVTSAGSTLPCFTLDLHHPVRGSFARWLGNYGCSVACSREHATTKIFIVFLSCWRVFVTRPARQHNDSTSNVLSRINIQFSLISPLAGVLGTLRARDICGRQPQVKLGLLLRQQIIASLLYYLSPLQLQLRREYCTMALTPSTHSGMRES